MRPGDFDRLYAEHAQGLFAFLAYRTGDRALAEDLLADTFERVLKARRGFDRRRGSEKTWVYSIALNRLRDHVRRQDAERRALERSGPDAAPAADALDAIGHRSDLIAALARLSAEEREAVALRYGADLTVPEIARVTGEPLTTVEGRVYRSLRKLRDLLEE
jgi:RNA polymerase sigma factor (sigma-70 family)